MTAFAKDLVKKLVFILAPLEWIIVDSITQLVD